MKTENKPPYLCDQYNKGGWLFRYSVLTSIAFWLHEKTCPDLVYMEDISPEEFEPMTPEMTGAEFKEYVEAVDGESEYAKFLYFQRGINKGKIDLANQLLLVIEDDDNDLWHNGMTQRDLVNLIKENVK